MRESIAGNTILWPERCIYGFLMSVPLRKAVWKGSRDNSSQGLFFLHPLLPYTLTILSPSTIPASLRLSKSSKPNTAALFLQQLSWLINQVIPSCVSPLVLWIPWNASSKTRCLLYLLRGLLESSHFTGWQSLEMHPLPAFLLSSSLRLS